MLKEFKNFLETVKNNPYDPENDKMCFTFKDNDDGKTLIVDGNSGRFYHVIVTENERSVMWDVKYLVTINNVAYNPIDLLMNKVKNMELISIEKR